MSADATDPVPEQWTIYDTVSGAVRRSGHGPAGIGALQNLGAGEQLLLQPARPDWQRVAVGGAGAAPAVVDVPGYRPPATPSGILTVPQGTLVVAASGRRTLYATATANAQGEATVLLTLENTAAGTPIFSQVWWHAAQPVAPAADVNGATIAYLRALSADRRSLTYGLARPNVLKLTLGLLYAPLAAVPAGTAVQFRVEGT